ncbi:hypothetical protein PsorP6_011543 [Peronosclerospora sorghi]|uniref:Uncharacterized protein n=1 Tax=Peronosclerospora sorghi TaxID=230839 RepID=A0ACC0WK59_9STRA|nr:hypothetical protein PsorP6_011543 [Peronosclerospora sorghi]
MAVGPRLHVLGLVAAMVLVSTSSSKTRNFCKSVTSCLKDGSAPCDATTGKCPPCIYALDDTYTCWEKENSTNTCPFTGVRYDCSDSWKELTKTGNSSSEAPSTHLPPSPPPSPSASPSGSPATISLEILNSRYFMYVAIGLGVLFVVALVGILCARRRKTRRCHEENGTTLGARNRSISSEKRSYGFSHPRDDTFAGPYNNINTTKVKNHTAIKMDSDPMDDTLSRVPTVESTGSVLTGSAQSTAVIGATFGSHKSGGRCIGASPVPKGIHGCSDVSEYVQQDVSSRCSSTPNVLGEYLRMKQEMQFDDSEHRIEETSGMDFSDVMSESDSRYSFQSSSESISQPMQPRTYVDGRSSIADSITDSIADSEYAEDLGRSDCFSDMSYNDEKYSFCSLDGLDDSQVQAKERKREFEI